jgi:accessory gene regulator protein AgrB
MDLFRWVFTGLLCGTALAAAAFFLLIQFARGVHADPEIDAATARRHARRRLGAGLVAVIATVFFVGVNYLDPRDNPVSYVWVWFLVGVMLIWLFALAMLDIRQTLRELRRRRDDFQEELRSWLRTRKNG